ncbi:MAG TPA: Pr6Pr family membrane protein [Caulobacteraceae bacterium]
MAGPIGRWARGAAALTALVAWGGLALQFALTFQTMTSEGASPGAALWRYLGYFTILTNLGVAIIASMMTLAPGAPVAGPRARLMTAASIAFVGIVFSVALRSTWSPTGWQAVANHALHDATPLLFLLSWALAGHGLLKWRDAGWALVPPGLYCAYALIRGTVDGWYAYWFLDPAKLGLAKLSLSIAALLAALLIVAVMLVAVDKWLARRPRLPTI